MRFVLLQIALALVLISSSFAAASRSELLFGLQTALKQHDREAITRCFNFEGLSDKGKESLQKIIDRLAAWPAHYVKTSERAQGGGESSVSLNGDWTFQVHIYADPQSQKGFVFPAGTTEDGCLILAAKD